MYKQFQSFKHDIGTELLMAKCSDRGKAFQT